MEFLAAIDKHCHLLMTDRNMVIQLSLIVSLKKSVYIIGIANNEQCLLWGDD